MAQRARKPTGCLCIGTLGVNVRICCMALVGNTGLPIQEDRLRFPPMRSAGIDANVQIHVFGQE
jgi:hypothetical protein